MKRKAVGFIFALLMFAVFLYGCGGGGGHSNPASPNISGLSRVSGVITDSNNQPVANAVVRLSLASNALINSISKQQQFASFRYSTGVNQTEFDTTTDSSGRYFFNNVPFGEYTLTAKTDNQGAIVSNLRISENNLQSNIKITPFGRIEATISNKSGNKLSYVIVGLDDTIYGVSDRDGRVIIDNVPVRDEPYRLTANLSGYELESNSRTIDCSFSKVATDTENNLFWKKDLSLVTITKPSCEITTSLEKDKLSSSPIYVFAISNVNTFVSIISGNSNSSSLKITENGKYDLFVVCSGLDFTVDHTSLDIDNLKEKNNISKVTLSLKTNPSEDKGNISGKINVPSNYLNILSKYPKDKLLVRLIGSSTTGIYYSDQYTISNNTIESSLNDGVNYSFTQVPIGSYSVFIDPAGNGMLGVATVSVEVSNTVTAPDIEVTFVRPEFTADVLENSDKAVITFKYPFISNSDFVPRTEESGTYTINNAQFICKNLLTSQGTNLDYFSKESEYSYIGFTTGSSDVYLTNNGKYAVIIQRKWSCNGFEGILTGTAEFEYNGATNYIGNVKVNKISHKVNPTDTSLDICVSTDYNNETYVSKIIGNNNYYKKVDEKNYSTYTTYDEVLDIVGCHSVYKFFDSTDNTNKLKYYNGNSEGQGYSGDLIATVASGYYVAGVAIITNDANKPDILVAYGILDTGGTLKPKLIKYSFSSSEYSGVEIELPNNVSNFLSGNTLKKFKNYVALSFEPKDDDTTSNVYFLNVDDYSAHGILCYVPNFIALNDFQLLKDGRFYIEVDSGDYIIKSYIFNSSGGAPVDKDEKTYRRSCFMDKYGFMYRYGEFDDSGSTQIGIIKTTSLSGEPLATLTKYKPESSDSENINGIIALEGDVLWAY